jgi:hypothetical protein
VNDVCLSNGARRLRGCVFPFYRSIAKGQLVEMGLELDDDDEPRGTER